MMNNNLLVLGPDHADTLFARQRFLYDALCTPAAAMVYRVGEELAMRFSSKSIVKSSDWDFNVEEFAVAGHCALQPHEAHYADVDARWDPDLGLIARSYDQGWYRVAWQDAHVEVLRLTFP